MLLGHMRILRSGLLLSILLLLLPATALCEEFPIQGQIGLSFAPDEWVDEISIKPFEPFDFYVRADLSADGGTFPLTTIEASLHYASQVFISEIDEMGATAGVMLNLEPGVLGMTWGWIIDCGESGDGLTAVLRLHAVVTSVADEILIGVQDLPGGVLEGLGPGWYDCSATTRYVFDASKGVGHNQLSLVASEVSNGDGTWGTWKASFDGEVQP